MGIAETHEDGSASAASTGVVSKADRVKSTVDESNAPQNSKADGKLIINLGHSDFNDTNLRNPKLWAKYMDRSLRAGLREASHKKLTGNKPVRLIRNVPAAGINYFIYTQLFGFSPVESLAIYTAARNTAIPMLDVAIGDLRKLTDFEFSSSVALGIPYDRVALASLYARTHRFAKVKKATKT